MNYRWEFLIKQIKENGYKIIAEVGVLKGNTMIPVLRKCDVTRYYAIDIEVQKKCCVDDRIKWIGKPSVEAAKEIPDKSLDLVFIDANHKYRHVKEDIMAWLPKARDGGMLCGHDYCPAEKGVYQAVNELLPHAKSEEMKGEPCGNQFRGVWFVEINNG